MDDKLRILVVGGHPADVFDHCGGTLAHHVQNGDSVTCLALTQGLRVHDVVIAEQFKDGVPEGERARFEAICAEREEVKYREVRDACACFGIDDVRFLSYDDSVLLETEPMIVSVAKVIRDVRPHILITHYPFEDMGVGSHHANAARIAMSARALAAACDFESSTPGWKVAQTFFMLASPNQPFRSYLNSLARYYCAYYVDIGDVVDKKVAALNCMKSQQYEGVYATKRTEVSEGSFGHMKDVGYAEGFMPDTPEIGRLLGVSRELLERANEPEADKRERGGVMTAPYL